ncbi:MAG TPA: alpha/beta hydrolase, partial [bacterium]|nr:alpha/beta hydrolase [bacterium]
MPQRFSFRSNDKTDIAVAKWIPEGEVKAVIQIVHGMNEHIGRHKLLAEFLYSKGFAVYGIDLRGHGLTA